MCTPLIIVYRANVDWYHKIENKCGFMEWLNQAGIYGTNQKEFSDIEIERHKGALTACDH